MNGREAGSWGEAGEQEQTLEKSRKARSAVTPTYQVPPSKQSGWVGQPIWVATRVFGVEASVCRG